MLERVLIANRGAIAVRIIRTLKAMGVKAIAVYADADRHSQHVRLADEVWSLGDGQRAGYLPESGQIAADRRSIAGAGDPSGLWLSQSRMPALSPAAIGLGSSF